MVHEKLSALLCFLHPGCYIFALHIGNNKTFKEYYNIRFSSPATDVNKKSIYPKLRLISILLHIGVSLV